jgi:hypothetical protein
MNVPFIFKLITLLNSLILIGLFVPISLSILISPYMVNQLLQISQHMLNQSVVIFQVKILLMEKEHKQLSIYLSLSLSSSPCISRYSFLSLYKALFTNISIYSPISLLSGFIVLTSLTFYFFILMCFLN